jgi:hypothetical protein
LLDESSGQLLRQRGDGTILLITETGVDQSPILRRYQRSFLERVYGILANPPTLDLILDAGRLHAVPPALGIQQ